MKTQPILGKGARIFSETSLVVHVTEAVILGSYSERRREKYYDSIFTGLKEVLSLWPHSSIFKIESDREI